MNTPGDHEDLTLEERFKQYAAKTEYIFAGLKSIEEQAPEEIEQFDEFLKNHWADLANPYREQSAKSLAPIIENWKQFQWTPLQLHYLYMHLMIAVDFQEMASVCENRALLEKLIRGGFGKNLDR